MVSKRICLFVGAIAAILFPVSSLYAANTAEIEAVRARTLQSKATLSPADQAILDKFVHDALEELYFEEDPWRAVDVRETILAQKGAADPSPYKIAFAEAVAKHLKTTFENAARLQNPDHRQRLTLNLIILAAGLQTTEMVQFGLDRLGDTHPTTQYWAVKTVTNPGVAAQLTSQVLGDEDLARRIISRLDQVVSDTMAPETMRMIVEFADRLNTAEARALVNKIADLRTLQYANWTVRYEMLEMPLLTALGKQIIAETADARRADLLRRFSQLYSYVIERYVLGENLLDELQKQQLVSVIAEIENGPITEILARPQNRLRKALEGGKGSVIDAERQILLGSATQPGQLAGKFAYDYGKGPGNAALTEPLRLKAPPALTASPDAAQP
ncbi:MAG TPA: hypothetical protein P5279_06475 [Anaerohalosphaeraceae bacterium]|jgi:hypothetical protein|nr:hypothetical protein [Anaerohalosphaeraceae bacterium]HRT50118.1 hypothetical protein [Anaerohalosphaeraceae bacterium]HRT86052.1 hypothetical protein [Anaerohalosphaeraceae bacterium]